MTAVPTGISHITGVRIISQAGVVDTGLGPPETSIISRQALRIVCTWAAGDGDIALDSQAAAL